MVSGLRIRTEWLRKALIVMGVLLLPLTASANAGTPLMWAGMLHLLFGNALIGLFEGLLASALFSVPRRKAVTLLIGANYFSAWVGGVFLNGYVTGKLNLDLNNAWKWFWILVFCMYLVTWLLELPFLLRCFPAGDRIRRSLKANTVIQTASYVALFGWYWMASGTSLFTNLRVVPPEDLGLSREVFVYFISDRDGDIYKASAHTLPFKIHSLGSSNRNDRLFVRRSAPDSDAWDLLARLDTEDRDGKIIPILTNLHVHAASDLREPRNEDTWFTFGEASSLDSPDSTKWKFRTGFWPIEGITAFEKATSNRLRFSYETPFGAWNTRNAFQVPSDKVVFQLGQDQICVMDPNTRKIALFWRGRGPVPVLENGASNNGPKSP